MGLHSALTTLALVLAGSAAALPRDSASVCCAPLTKGLSNVVYTADKSDYNKLINERWSGTSVLHPGCVIAPKSAQDVADAMKIITRNQCQFAVRSGGHNANPGANSIDGGVSIDLSSLKNATLAQDRSHVSLGAGVTWGEAYDTFAGTGIGFTGGICEDVGVGGVSIGGGQSLFQPKRGWAIDNIVNYEIVLASGQIVNANQTSNPDLFKALKGGNTNFGIVTKVDIAAFEFDGLWGGEVFVALEGPFGINLGKSREEVLDQMSHAITDFTANNHQDLDTAVQLMSVYLSHGLGHVINAAFGNTADKEKPDSLKPFLDMPNQVPFKTHYEHTKLNDFVHKVSEFQAKGYREVTASVTYFNDYQTTREIWDATDKIYSSLPFKDEVDWMISFIPQPEIQQTYAAQRGGNSLGLADVKGDQMVLWLTSRWKDPKYDSQMEDVRQQFIDDVESVTKKNNKYHPFLYVNYAAPSQNPLCGYGKESFDFLKSTSSKYDPDRVFQKLMPGGFKVDNTTCN